MIPGVYEEWTEAQKQITNVKGPKFKKFSTREEADEFVRTGGKSTGKKAIPKSSFETAKAAKAAKAALQQKLGSKAAQAELSQPATKKAKISIDPISKGNTVKVYTDGSSLSNGKVGAIAGVGVYFGDGDRRYFRLCPIIKTPY